jgi:hypothetical protein
MMAEHFTSRSAAVRTRDPHYISPEEEAAQENARIGERLQLLTSIVQAIADAEPEDTVGSLKIDIPSGGKPRSWLHDAAKKAVS